VSTAEPLGIMTLGEFLTWEELQPDRHELVGSRIYAMSGGTERHSLMKDYLFELVAPVARAAGCQAFGEGRRLLVPSGDLYYPDLMVRCRPAGHNLHETDATFIVEVLSASTRGTDRREKLRGYQNLASIRAYAMVEPDIRRIEVARWARGDILWDTYGAGDVVDIPYGTWALDGIYDVVDSMATP
jgi:Uma2 family endonuclease